MPSHHLDFQSQGGYIVAPPSQGDGKPYRLITRPGGSGTLDWDAVTPSWNPQRRPHQAQGARLPAST